MTYEKETEDNSEEVRRDVLAAYSAADLHRHRDLRHAFDILLDEMFSGFSRKGSLKRAFNLMDRNMFGWWD